MAAEKWAVGSHALVRSELTKSIVEVRSALAGTLIMLRIIPWAQSPFVRKHRGAPIIAKFVRTDICESTRSVSLSSAETAALISDVDTNLTTHYVTQF